MSSRTARVELYWAVDASSDPDDARSDWLALEDLMWPLVLLSRIRARRYHLGLRGDRLSGEYLRHFLANGDSSEPLSQNGGRRTRRSEPSPRIDGKLTASESVVVPDPEARLITTATAGNEATPS
jgi:hypothetical protein